MYVPLLHCVPDRTVYMTGPILYSTNPWYSLEIARKYRGGIHFAWVSEFFDADTAPPATAGFSIAPSSNPQLIYNDLWKAVDKEDTHSSLIKGYKKTFRLLAAQWFSNGDISSVAKDEILATVNSHSFKIWRPMLYVIPRGGIDSSRIISVPHKKRAAYGPESQIQDLKTGEFDVVEFRR